MTKPFKAGDKVTAFGHVGEVIDSLFENSCKVWARFPAELHGGYLATFEDDGRFEHWHKEPSLKHFDEDYITAWAAEPISRGEPITVNKEDDKYIARRITKQKTVKMAPALYKYKNGYHVSEKLFMTDDEADQFEIYEFVKLLWDRAVEVEI